PMIARYFRYRRMYNPADKGIQLRLMTEQLPRIESALHLSDECDELGIPIVEMDWRIDGGEIATMATFSQAVARFLENHRLARVRLHPDLLSCSKGILKNMEDGYHQMGMARMAASAADGVVDRDLRVFGTHNPHVAGAAVYPTTGFANPT